MNKLLKKLAAFGLSLTMLTGVGMGIVGCGDSGKTDEPEIPPIVDPSYDPDKGKEPDVQEPDKEPDKKPDDKPENPPVTEKKTLEEAKDEYEEFTSKHLSSGKFEYHLMGPAKDISVRVDGNKAEITESDSISYCETAEGENFVYSFKEGNYHKNFAEEGESTIQEISSQVQNALDIDWTDYKDDKLTASKLVMTQDGQEKQVEVWAYFVVDGKNKDLRIDVADGSTQINFNELRSPVTLPENVIDETAKNENIFTVENGETIWNVKAIKEVLESWVKNEMTDAKGNHVDNQFGEDVFSYMRMNSDYKSREVVYVNMTDKMTFGMIFDVGDQIRFGQIYLNNTTLMDGIKKQEIKTQKDLGDFLLTVRANTIKNSIVDFDVEYTTHDEDYETAHKQEFETLTKNVFEKYQKEKTAEQPDYNGAEILFAFKTPMGPINGHGDGRQWEQFYLVNNKGELKLIKFEPRGLLAGVGCLQNVLQNVDERWTLEFGLQKIADIDSQNLQLCDTPEMTIGNSTNLSKEL